MSRDECAAATTRPERAPYDEPQTWYFTFGAAHAHPSGYVRFDGLPGDVARTRMHLIYGREWAFQYDAHDWFKHGVSMAEKHGLHEVDPDAEEIRGRTDAVLGYCPHGVDLDRDFCPEGCRV